ncbi:MAG: FliM/FliN family flagellar motor switch protein [Chthoniobacteraceae bacterium]
MSNATACPDPEVAPAAGSDGQPVFLMDGSRTSAAKVRIAAHDFRNPCAISQADMRVFEVLYPRFIQNLAARLSTFLRMECTLKLTKLTCLSFSQLCEALPPASCITLFKLEDQRGVGILNLHLPLALATADRLLGGKGRAPSAERQLTEIELTLMDDAFQLFLSTWSEAWAGGGEAARPKIIGHETSARCLPASSPSDVLVMLAVEMSAGATTGLVELAVPFSMVEGAVRKIRESQNIVTETRLSKPVQWRKQYAGIQVPVIAEWKVREMPLAETLHIRQGDVIELPNSLINRASLHLSEVTTFIGTVGIQNGNVAIQITGHSNKE